MSDRTQTFEKHAKMVPLYHLWTTALLAFPTLYFAYRTVTAFSLDRLALLAFAVGTILAAFFARFFPLGVQDRVIRLEERIRLDRLLPDELRTRTLDLSTEQLIGLRFASDEELAELVERVLREGMTDRSSIKRAIRAWRADHQRI